ncbi:hypothetical protein AAC387_Pa04g0502 [Persea americana]
MSSSQRSESFNAFLKQFETHKCGLHDFMMRFERAITCQRDPFFLPPSHHPSPRRNQNRPNRLSDQNPLTSKSPEKLIQALRRPRNIGVARSSEDYMKTRQYLLPKDMKKVVEDPKIDAGLIPEKYKMLVEFSNCLLSSIRLLQLKGLRSTFTNISPQIETLTGRQILIRDERTVCVKPDLQVALQLDAFKNSGKLKMESGYSVLKNMVHARLLDFFKVHPEGDYIPGETLPEPFNQTKLNVFAGIPDTPQEFLTVSFDQTKPSIFPSSIKNICESQLPIPSSSETPLHQPSHMSQSFRRQFSRKIMQGCEETKLHPSLSPVKCPSKPPTSERSFTFSPSQFKLPPSSSLRRGEESEPTESEDHTPKELDSIEGTSLKQQRSQSHPIRVRSLKFHTPVKNAKSGAKRNESEMSSAEAAIIEFLPETLLQSVREKERKAMEDYDAGVIEAKRRQQMIACLPKLFGMIHLIFESMKRLAMTEQELMYKIIVNHPDRVDKEQLKLLQELVPDWISVKMSSSDDFLFCVNNTRSSKSIHARLAEAE